MLETNKLSEELKALIDRAKTENHKMNRLCLDLRLCDGCIAGDKKGGCTLLQRNKTGNGLIDCPFADKQDN
jgi:signal transduction histidine kinase